MLFAFLVSAGFYHLFIFSVSGYHIYLTPPLGQDMTQGQFLSGVSQV